MTDGSDHTLVRLETRSSPLTIEPVPRSIAIFSLSESEIEAITSACAPLSLAFFGICIGSAIAFLLALVTAPPSGAWFGAFVALDAVSFVLAIYFGLETWKQQRDWERRKRKMMRPEGNPR